MRRPYQKAVSLLMLLVSLIASLGAYGFDSTMLIHEMDHDRQTNVVSGDHHPVPQLDVQDIPNPPPLSDAEHILLHALNHFDQFPSWTFVGLSEPTLRQAPALPYLLTLLAAALESPFRPPRSTSLP